VRLVLLDLEDVPAIDATGIVNLRSAVDRLQSGGIVVILTGLQPQPRSALEKARLVGEGGVEDYPGFEQAMAAARERLAELSRRTG